MADLFVSRSTLNCAKSQCIPCLYKILPSGLLPLKRKEKKKRKHSEETTIASSEVLKLPPNQRPENCHRAKNPQYYGLYTRDQAILTLGDGDLSFSLSLAKEFRKQRSSVIACSSSGLTASTYEKKDTLLKTYPDIGQRFTELEEKGGVFYDGVDATNLALSSSLVGRQFDVIVWNFPCVRIENGLDGQVSELDMNKQLLQRFFANVKPFLTTGTGEVHLTHKTIEPFSWWGIENIAVENGFRKVLSICFDKYNYPSYVNRKALDKKSFPCNDAQVR